MAGLFLACCCPGLAQVPKQPPPIGAVFSPHAGLLATTRSDSKIIIWDVATGKEKLRFDVEDRSFGILFSPDGKVLATIGRTKPATATIWDVATGKKLAVLKNREREFGGLVFSGEHQCAAAANADGTVAIWSDFREEPKTVAEEPSEKRLYLAFSRDGKNLLVRANATARVWDLTNDKILMKELRAGPAAKAKESCYPGSLSADGSLLIGQGVSGLVRIWDVGKETSRIDINVGRPSNLLPPVLLPMAAASSPAMPSGTRRQARSGPQSITNCRSRTERLGAWRPAVRLQNDFQAEVSRLFPQARSSQPDWHVKCQNWVARP